MNKSSPHKRGSSNPLILKTLDYRLRGNNRLVQTLLKLLHFGYRSVTVVAAIPALKSMTVRLPC
jgi:hypothetical protein